MNFRLRWCVQVVRYRRTWRRYGMCGGGLGLYRYQEENNEMQTTYIRMLSRR